MPAVVAMAMLVLAGCTHHLPRGSAAYGPGASIAATPAPSPTLADGQAVPWLALPYRPYRAPSADPLNSLSASLGEYPRVEGSQYAYTVVLRNLGFATETFNPCPNYIQDVAARSEQHQLNCQKAGAIESAGDEEFEMRTPAVAGATAMHWYLENSRAQVVIPLPPYPAGTKVPCSPDLANVTLGHNGVFSQRVILQVLITNTWASPCYVDGYPGFNVVGGDGSRAVPTQRDPQWLDGGSYKPMRIELQPHQQAQFDTWFFVPGSGRTPCATSSYANVQNVPPRPAWQITYDGDACGPIHFTPWIAGGQEL